MTQHPTCLKGQLSPKYTCWHDGVSMGALTIEMLPYLNLQFQTADADAKITSAQQNGQKVNRHKELPRLPFRQVYYLFN